MKRFAIILLSLLLSIGFTYGQKGNAGGGSGSTDDTNNNDNRGGGGGGGTDVLSLITLLSGKYHKSQLRKSKKIPIISSFEMTADAGFGVHSGNSIAGYMNFFPQARINFGAYYGEAKFDYLKAADSNLDTEIKDLNFLVGLNFTPANMFRAYAGLGAIYNLDEKLTYPQASAGIDIAIMDRMLVFTPEVFYAYDFNEGLPYYSEYGLRGAFKFLSVGSANFYVNAGGDYRKYGENYDMIHFYGGLELVFW